MKIERVGLLALLVLCTVGLILLLPTAARNAAAEQEMERASLPAETNAHLFLPMIVRSPTPLVYANVLANPSFEEGWENMPPAPGNLINQQPTSWTLEWVEIGDFLYDSEDVADGVPECVHKHNEQLPEDERIGGPKALVLDGEWTYNIFHFTAPFGAELRQTVTGLTAGTVATLTVPIQLHVQGVDWESLDPYAAESGVWVNGQGEWANISDMQDRTWYTHTVSFVVPESGVAEVLIRVKSKYHIGMDFFMDDLQLIALIPVTELP